MRLVFWIALVAWSCAPASGRVVDAGHAIDALPLTSAADAPPPRVAPPDSASADAAPDATGIDSHVDAAPIDGAPVDSAIADGSTDAPATSADAAAPDAAAPDATAPDAAAADAPGATDAQLPDGHPIDAAPSPCGVDCDDGDPCTSDSCDPAGGCSHVRLPAGCCSSAFVWPTTGTDQQTLISSTYGPRLKFSAGDRYDWHQGLDLPGHDSDDGFEDPVYAVADGEIYRLGNLPATGGGAVTNFSAESGNLIILKHTDADTGLSEGTLYSLYLHLADLDLASFPARQGDVTQLIDMREYFFLDGADTTDTNRGTRRSSSKTSGVPITQYPRFRKADGLARIGASGSPIAYEHLHFELRDREEPATTPAGVSRVWARNPYQYLPHDPAPRSSVSLSSIDDGLVVRIDIHRTMAPRGEPVAGDQKLDVERVRVELREGTFVVANRELDFFHDINQQGADAWSDGMLGFDHDDMLSDAYVPEQPDRSLGGVRVRLRPAAFTSFDDTWTLEVELTNLAAAAFLPAAGQHFAASVIDVCGAISATE